MQTPVRLISDYSDFYDHHFDPEGLIWKRYAHNSLSRRGAFRLLKKYDLPVPPFGTVEELAESIPYELLLEVGDECDVIVYLDEYAHHGEQKIKMNIMEAYESHPEELCSLYMAQATTTCVGYTWVKIGDAFFWLEYNSDDSWRSNCGNVLVKYPEHIPMHDIFDQLYYSTDSFPMCTIDFIQSQAGLWWAVDLNIAPIFKDTPLEVDLGAECIATLIKEFYFEHQVRKV
jgi:hypothetical protein